MDKYDLNHRKLIRRPFMTLNVLLVGKFHKNIENLSTNREKLGLYRNDDDDPDIFSPQHDEVRDIVLQRRNSFFAAATSG